MPDPPVIGLAGGIGAGKSTVAAILEDLGCVVARSDEMGRAALRDPEIRDTLVSWWGRGVLDGDGEIDRSAVARIVFADPAERRRLESLTHPWIEARRRERFEAEAERAVAFVIDAPLLFEAGLDEICDAVIFVDAPRELRLRRVASRGWDEGELDRREGAQMPLDAKRRRADDVIVNDGDPGELVARVERVLRRILTDHTPGGTQADGSRPSDPGSPAG